MHEAHLVLELVNLPHVDDVLVELVCRVSRDRCEQTEYHKALKAIVREGHSDTANSY